KKLYGPSSLIVTRDQRASPVALMGAETSGRCRNTDLQRNSTCVHHRKLPLCPHKRKLTFSLTLLSPSLSFSLLLSPSLSLSLISKETAHVSTIENYHSVPTKENLLSLSLSSLPLSPSLSFSLLLSLSLSPSPPFSLG